MADLKIRSAEECKYDEVSLGEVEMEFGRQIALAGEFARQAIPSRQFVHTRAKLLPPPT